MQKDFKQSPAQRCLSTFRGEVSSARLTMSHPNRSYAEDEESYDNIESPMPKRRRICTVEGGNSPNPISPNERQTANLSPASQSLSESAETSHVSRVSIPPLPWAQNISNDINAGYSPAQATVATYVVESGEETQDMCCFGMVSSRSLLTGKQYSCFFSSQNLGWNSWSHRQQQSTRDHQRGWPNYTCESEPMQSPYLMKLRRSSVSWIWIQPKRWNC